MAGGNNLALLVALFAPVLPGRGRRAVVPEPDAGSLGALLNREQCFVAHVLRIDPGCALRHHGCRHIFTRAAGIGQHPVVLVGTRHRQLNGFAPAAQVAQHVPRCNTVLLVKFGGVDLVQPDLDAVLLPRAVGSQAVAIVNAADGADKRIGRCGRTGGTVLRVGKPCGCHRSNNSAKTGRSTRYLALFFVSLPGKHDNV